MSVRKATKDKKKNNQFVRVYGPDGGIVKSASIDLHWSAL